MSHIKQVVQVILDVFGIRSAANVIEMPKVVFFREAAYHGDHGTILVTNRGQRLTESQVKFAFVGLRTAPALDRNIIQHIWMEALSQGYIPHAIVKYGSVINTQIEAN